MRGIRHLRLNVGISRLVLRLLVIRLDAEFPHAAVHPEPPFMKVWVEVGFFARKVAALKTEIDSLLPVARGHSAVRIFAVAPPAPLAVRLAEVGEQLLECGIVLINKKEF